MIKITQLILAKSRNNFKTIAILFCWLFMTGGAFGQITVTIGGGGPVTCPAVPTATYTPVALAGIEKETSLRRIAAFENKAFLKARKVIVLI